MKSNNKKKYIEKPKNKIIYKQKEEQLEDDHEQQQKLQIKPVTLNNLTQKNIQPRQKKAVGSVINVKVFNLRLNGYNSLLQWLQNPNHVYIGRNMSHYVPGAVGSKWANPFKVDKFGREECIEKYRQHIINNKNILKDLHELKDKVLGCWCAPEACHGDILVELANNLQ